MNTFIISYDLGLPESRHDYNILISYIKSHTYWAKPLQSVWFIKTVKSASQIRNEIKDLIDSNDKVIVIDISGKRWASYNISKIISEWMQRNI